MKNLRTKRPRYIWKSILLPGLIMSAMMVVLIFGVLRFEAISTEQDLKLTEQAVKKATIQCYANEGRYPASVSYLEENYNITIDYDRFFVNYDCAAANIMPNISVFSRRR